MLTVDEALAAVLAVAQPLPPTRVPLLDSLGCRLAKDVMADVDSPPHNKSMMDGYAVVSSDRAPRRKVVEEIMAGQVPRETVVAGTAARIMTGAPIPLGADAVVPVERSRMVDDTMVELDWLDPPPSKHIMPRGDVMHRGERVLRCGELVTPATIGLLAEVGIVDVKVIRRPRIAILPTGNELVEAGEIPPAGSIRNSNGPMLAAAVASAGCEPILMPIGCDDRKALAESVLEGLDFDMLIVTGGVSAGKLDFVPDVLASCGVEQVFHKVAMKPGKPIWFGQLPRTGGPPRLVFGLPGNPVSSFVGFQVFVRSAIARLAGEPELAEWPKATLTVVMHPTEDRELFCPVQVSWHHTRLFLTATPVAWRGSADLRGLASGNGLLHLPMGTAPKALERFSVLIYGTIGAK